ncbi:hypothetical protein M3Y95_00108700 [Aphelenchoides besseyi]|nr:hypothetical protein M3Y95_00108700 [Aphelenchoides besseyi]
MYSVIHETDSPTAVSHSIYGRFLPGNERQLVSVSLKTLRIYRINQCARYIDSEDHKWKQGVQLECLYKVDLLAPVRSLATARVPLCPSIDSLLLAFDDGKISIVNYDNSHNSLQTTSLHDFDDDDLRDGYSKETGYPLIRTDPAQRCAAVLIHGRYLAILPLGDTVQDIKSYTLSLRNVEARLDNVIDMIFLHGYYEPTAAIRYDTVSIVGVSLNVKDRVHAVVWNLSGLPSTISQCLSLPLPLGGVCLFGSNEIIYLNQSVPPCGLSLNSDADEYTRFPLTDAKSTAITLDGCSFDILDTNEIIIGTRRGDLYVLTLDLDISNAVKRMQLSKVFEAPVPYTLTVCSDYIFCGSRLGDSVLLECFTEKIEANGVTEQSETQANDEQMDDEEDIFLYGTAEKEKITHIESKTVRNIKIVDRLLNAAPCKVLRAADASSLSEELRNQKKSVYFDLVSATGHEKQSKLCFFQRTIRPSIQSTSVYVLGPSMSTVKKYFSIEDALELFTVGRREDDSQKYLVVARENSSFIYELMQEDMRRLDRPLFITDETTIAAGELANSSISVQVTALNIVLVGTISDEYGDEQLAMENINSNFPVVSVSIVDPFISLTTQSGQLLLYKLETEPNISLKQVNVSSIVLNPEDRSSITAVCVYKDVSGLIKLSSSGDHFNESRPQLPQIKQEFPSMQPEEVEMDEVDMMLYGDVEKEKQPTIVEDVSPLQEIENPKDSDVGVSNPDLILPTNWILVTRESGHLYIYNEALEIVYCVKKFNNLPEILKHNPIETLNADDTFADQTIDQLENSSKPETVTVKDEEIVTELRLTGLGLNQGRPVLSVLIDDTVVFYELFSFDEGFPKTLAIRFRKLTHSVVTRSARFLASSGRNPVESTRDLARRRSLITFYDHIGDLFNGLFIGGNYPTVMFLSHGEFLVHPIICDGPLASLCPLNNNHCPDGFATLGLHNCVLRTARLDPNVHYNTSHPVRIVPFDETVRFVVYLLHWNIYALISNTPVRNNKVCSVLNEDKHFETHERSETYVWPEMDKYKLQLFSTEDWKFIPNSVVEFDEFESVTCCEEVLLNSESTVWGLQSYLAVGTAINYSEEVFVRGRVLIYEIIEVVPEEGLPTTRHRLKCVYDKEQKGPVTSICHCNGYFLTGMGQKIFIWQFKDGMLNGVSFLDMHFYVHNLVGFRSLALACDMFHSISLVRYQEEFKVLSLVSRDLRSSVPPPMAAQFLLDRNQLGFVLSDENGNVSVFNYMPEASESFGGERLILRASLNIGSPANGLVRVNGHVGEAFTDNEDTAKEIQTIIMATLDGSWAAVRPVNERAFKRLQGLQSVMLAQVSQIAGLNQRGARGIRPRRLQQQGGGTNRQMIDGNFVFQYMNLSVIEKTDLARASGSNRYQIMDDILEICRAVTHF